MARLPRTIRRFVYTAAVLCALLAVSIPLIVPRFLDTAYLKQSISHYVFNQFDVHLTIDAVSIALLPTPGITVNGITADTPAGQRITVRRAALLPDLAQLIRRKVSVQKLSLTGVSLTAIDPKPDKKANLHPPAENPVKEPAGLNIPEGFPTQILIHDFHAAGIESADFSVTLNPENGTALVEASCRNIMPAKHPDMSGHLPDFLSTLIVKNARATLVFKSFTDIDLTLTLNNPGLSHSSNLVSLPKSVTAKCSYDQGRISAEIKPARFGMPDMTAGIAFDHDLASGYTRLTFSGKHVNMDQARKTSLDLFGSDPIVNELFTIIRGGTARQVSVRFQADSPASLFDPETMVIRGTVDNARVAIPETRLLVSGISGKARVEHGVLHTSVISGTVENATLDKGQLSVELLSRHPDFSGTFVLNADLARLPGVLMDLLPGSILARELALLDSASGRASGILTLEKNKTGMTVGVKAGNIQIDSDYQRIPGHLSFTTDTFTLKEDVITVSGINGRMGKHRFIDVNGTVTLSDDPVMELYSGPGSVDLFELFNWVATYPVIRDALMPLTGTRGTFCLSTAGIQGSIFRPDEWIFHVGGSASDVTLATEESQNEITDLHCRVQATDRFLVLSKVSARINHPYLITTLTGAEILSQLAMPATLTDTYVETLPTQRFSMGQATFDSGPTLTFNAGEDNGHITLNSITFYDAGASNALLLPPLLPDSQPFHLRGKIATGSLKKLLKPESRLMETFQEKSLGLDFSITSNGDNRFTLLFDTLDLNRKIQELKGTGHSVIQESKPSKTEGKKAFDLPWPGPVSIVVNTLITGNLEFSPVTGSLEKTGETYLLDIDRATFCTLDLQGSVFGSMNGNNLNINAVIDPQEICLSETLHSLLATQGLIEGQGTVSGNFTTQGSAMELYDNLEGTIQLTGTPGRIFRLTLLSRILSVINISNFIQGRLPDMNQEGFAYDSLEMDVHILGEKVILNSFIIRGQDMTLFFSGWIDKGTNSLDLVCLVAPFKSADIIIEKIPILNTVMAGRLIAIPVRITGSIADPDIAALPAESIGKGISDTLERIITLPMTILGRKQAGGQEQETVTLPNPFHDRK